MVKKPSMNATATVMEVNNDYRTVLQEHGMMLSGISPDGRIVEMIELPDHPMVRATQAHPG